MRAIVYHAYGSPDVLEVAEVEKPTPRDDEVLVRTRATTVTAGDRRARSLDVPLGFGLAVRLVFGVRRPRRPILGTELAGDVEAVGRRVTRFKPGDPVFALTGISMGGYAEYACLREGGAIARKPENLSYEEAAALSFGGTTALDFFRRGKLQRGERVLVNGAAGGVGTAAVQLAKYFGADVTGVCSAVNAELVRSLGADHVIDYAQEDFAAGGERFDVIMDTVGNAPWSRSNRALREGGRLLLVVASLPQMLQGPWVSMGRRKVVAGPVPENVEDLQLLADLARQGAFHPFIGRRYKLEEMAEAHRYVDTGHKRGNVVVTVG